MALILRNGGSQNPDRWLKEPRNNQKSRKHRCITIYGQVSYLISAGASQKQLMCKPGRRKRRSKNEPVLMVYRIHFFDFFYSITPLFRKIPKSKTSQNKCPERPCSALRRLDRILLYPINVWRTAELYGLL